ncbi:zinc finger protein 862-like [Branchiostoma lanceolatum]|uniref:zinc finger protein 862-like n=1 Tax=Branchiostoma lanceolatum TaxID=7740 RepID=UPI003456E05B
MDVLRAMQGDGGGGAKFREFKNNLVVNNGDTYFKGEKIKSTRQMRQAVDGVRQNFIDNLIVNMDGRFPDIGLFKALRILDPKSLSEDNATWARFGEDELQSILEHNAPAEREPVIKSEECSMEWPTFKELVHANYKNYSFQNLVNVITTNHAGYLPETTKLLNAVAVIPMSTVPCERVFSVQNRIKTKGRARLKAENLDVLMRISIEGPAIEHFDFYRALHKFRAAKQRRIFQGLCPEGCPCRQR